MCRRNAVFFPIVLILVGLFFLLRNYGVLPEGLAMGKLWPVLLVVVGAGALLRRARCRSGEVLPKGN